MPCEVDPRAILSDGGEDGLQGMTQQVGILLVVEGGAAGWVEEICRMRDALDGPGPPGQNGAPAGQCRVGIGGTVEKTSAVQVTLGVNRASSHGNPNDR